MRLTAELIQNSLSFLNPLKERELDLRENLAVAGPQDAIDFTDNDIVALSNFPLSLRLRTLLLARNRLTTIQSNLATNLPNLTTLVLTQNNFAELADLDALRLFTKLTHLSLLENPVTRKDNYRYFLIWLTPSLRFLDYEKVKDVERSRAAELFGTLDEPSALASKIMGLKSHGGAELGDSAGGNAYSEMARAQKTTRVRLTEKEKKKVEQMIRNATSLQEIARLEKDLNEGRVPAGAMDLSDG